MIALRPEVQRLLSLLALLAASGCSCGGWEVYKEVTPWLRLESRSPILDLPHIVEIGDHAERASVRREGRWRPLEVEGRRPQAQSFDGERRAILGDGLWHPRWRVLHESGSIIELPPVCEGGPLRTLADDELLCVACPRVPGGPPCEQFEVARLDVDGARVAGESLRLPPEYAECEINQVIPVGLVGEHAAIEVSLYCKEPTGAVPGTRGVCALLAVEPGRLRTALAPKQAEPCCAGHEWARCAGKAMGFTRRYF